MKKIKQVKASGYGCVVEMLTTQEASGSLLTLGNASSESTQAYIKSVGPLVDKKNGFKVGTRVLLQGTFVPVPNPDTSSSRKWGVVETHAIKAVLEEEETEAV